MDASSLLEKTSFTTPAAKAETDIRNRVNEIWAEGVGKNLHPGDIGTACFMKPTGIHVSVHVNHLPGASSLSNAAAAPHSDRYRGLLET